MKFSTKAIHEGSEPGEHGDVIPAIHLSTTFKHEAIGIHGKFQYGRCGNPSREAVERQIASLENGKFGLGFSSGLAAIDCVLKTLKQGDKIVASDDLYGGTRRLLTQVYSRFGIGVEYVDTTNVELVKKKINDDVKLLWLETPSNPILKVSDIKDIVESVGRNDLVIAVDNTFMTPYFQNPLSLGVDVVVHSTSKYLGGHSDSIGGAVVVNNEKLYEELKFHQNATGAIMSPFDSWLLLRSIKTLSIRMEKHNSNAQKIAEWLAVQKRVKKVYYPGLEDNEYHQLAKTQMGGFGGVISFEIDEYETFLENLEMVSLAESLAGVESLIAHPWTMSHCSVPEEEKIRLGINKNLLRLSVGIEDVEDIIADLEQAMEKI
jgi:cystathionine gamma-lyase